MAFVQLPIQALKFIAMDHPTVDFLKLYIIKDPNVKYDPWIDLVKVNVYFGPPDDGDSKPMQGHWRFSTGELIDCIDDSRSPTRVTTYQGVFKDAQHGSGTINTTWDDGQTSTENWVASPQS